mgnify:CR=1 FL=1
MSRLKRYSAAIAVLAMAGLVGVLVRPWTLRTVNRVESGFAQRAFQRQAREMVDCANDRMAYSQVIGAFKTVGTTRVTLNILAALSVDPDDKTANDFYNTIVREVGIVIACAEHVRAWDTVTLWNHSLSPADGISATDGQRETVVVATVIWGVSLPKSEATLFLQALDQSEFIESRIKDGTIAYFYFGEFFGFPQNPANLDGSLVLGAVEKQGAFLEARKLLTQGKTP